MSKALQTNMEESIETDIIEEVPEDVDLSEGKRGPYTDGDGNVYESREAFFNSPDLDDYRVMIYLHSGNRKPQNEYERRLLQEMKDIEARGEIIDFSENIW